MFAAEQRRARRTLAAERAVSQVIRGHEGKGMQIFGLAGWSGSGKTTLLTGIIPELTARGLAVSTIKHAHHEFDIDRPGKEFMAASSGRRARGHGRLIPPLGLDARAARQPRAEPRRIGRADDPGGSAARRGFQASPATRRSRCIGRASARSCSTLTTPGSSRSLPMNHSPRRSRYCRSATRPRWLPSSRIIWA